MQKHLGKYLLSTFSNTIASNKIPVVPEDNGSMPSVRLKKISKSQHRAGDSGVLVLSSFWCMSNRLRGNMGTVPWREGKERRLSVDQPADPGRAEVMFDASEEGTGTQMQAPNRTHCLRIHSRQVARRRHATSTNAKSNLRDGLESVLNH